MTGINTVNLATYPSDEDRFKAITDAEARRKLIAFLRYWASCPWPTYTGLKTSRPVLLPSL